MATHTPRMRRVPRARCCEAQASSRRKKEAFQSDWRRRKDRGVGDSTDAAGLHPTSSLPGSKVTMINLWGCVGGTDTMGKVAHTAGQRFRPNCRQKEHQFRPNSP